MALQLSMVFVYSINPRENGTDQKNFAKALKTSLEKGSTKSSKYNVTWSN